ncbi:hypothetical protein KKA14_02695 [bacterium]|nr:hypothetical protein [bacterium]
MSMDIQILADEMYGLVAETHGVERYKPQDVFKVIIEKYKDEGVSKKDCKVAMRTLIESEKLVYTVLNGSCTSLVGLPSCEEDGTNA